MKIGLAFASSVGTDGDSALEICRRAEAIGFESVWGGEHVVLPDSIDSKYPYTPDGKIPAESDTPIPDPLIWLAFVAAAVPRLRLGTCILIVPQRNPLVLAKELATLDQLSGGRVELGLGVGWLKEEFETLGVLWERRGARNDEYVAAMRALWEGPHAEFHGEFVDFEASWAWPKPSQQPRPRVLIGGAAGPKLFAQIAEFADGWMPIGGAGMKAAIGDLRAAVEERGRDASALHIVPMGVFPDEQKLEYYRGLGVTETVLRIPGGQRDDIMPVLDSYTKYL